MADRSVAVRLSANVQGFVTGMRSARTAADDFATKGLDKIGRNSQHITTLSNQAGALGLAMVGGFAAATKAAVDWETAWAGVLKTVDGSDEELSNLEESLREMARTMPVTHQEIASVAEAAGQLGVAAPDVAEFTETMLQLGVATNLTADEAATSLARLANIMGSSTDEVSRMGATIVDLGNNSATTESEIVELGTRLAAAGRQAGLTEADIFAIASTLSSVGVEAEAGGTAMSKVFISIADAVRDGGDQLDTFAQVSGLTAQEFQRAFGEDAAGAIGLFVDGMGRMSAEGESTSQVFRDLGLTDQRLMRAILSAGSATGLWADQLELAGEAWDDNSAHVDEFDKRLQTAQAQITIAWNNIKDAAIEFGADVLPMLAQVAGAVSDGAQAFGSLPQPIKTATTLLTGAGGLTLLGVAGMGKLAVSIFEARSALNSLKVSGRAAGLALGGVTAAITVGTAALGAWASAQAEARQRAQEYQDTLDSVTGSITNQTRELAAQRLATEDGGLFGLGATNGSALDAAEDLGISLELVTEAAIGNSEALRELQVELDAAAAGNNDVALANRGLFRDIRDVENAVAGENASLEEAIRLAEQTEEATDGLSGSQQGLEGATDSTTDSIEDQTDALWENTEAARENAGLVLSERDAQRQFQAAIDEASAALEENGRTLDRNTSEGRANERALDALAESGWDLIESMRENGATNEDLQSTMATTRRRFLDTASSMGLSEDAASDLADQLGLIPSTVNTSVSVSGITGAQRQIESFISRNTGRNIYVDVIASAQSDASLGSHLGGGRASGGPVTGGTTYLVGENGPELFTPSSTGMITNTSATAAMGSPFVGLGAQVAPSVSVGSPEVAVYVQAIPDGEYVRQQAGVVVNGALTRQAHAIENVARV